MGNQKKRELWIDICRGIGIILVLLGHNNPPFIKFIYGFHMPLFYILSGYLYKKDDHLGDWTYIKKIMIRYIGSYLILGLCNMILHVVHLIIVTRDIEASLGTVGGYLISIITVGSMSEMPACAPLWFLPSLACSLIIYMYIRKLKKPVLRICAVFLLALAGKIFEIYGISILLFKINTVLYGTVFVAVGHLLKESGAVDKVRDNCSTMVKTSIVLIAALAGSLAIYYNHPGTWLDISVQRIGNPLLTITGGVAVSYALMLLFSCVESYMKKIGSFLALLGTHTLFVLGFDEQSNAWGGTVLNILNLPVIWYQAFIIRLFVLIVLWGIWRMFLGLIKNEKIHKFLDF